MNKFIKLNFFVLLLLFSCKNKQVIDKLEFNEIKKIKGKVISVNTNKIVNAVNINIVDSVLFIEDFINQNQCIVALSCTTGKLLASFAQKGKGPGELISPSMNSFISSDSTIQIYDNHYKKICEYSTKGRIGRFLKEYPLPFQQQRKDDELILELFKIGNSYLAIGNSKRFEQNRLMKINGNECSYSENLIKIPEEISPKSFKEILMYARKIAWNPDHTKLVFTSYLGGRFEIYSINKTDLLQNICTKNFLPYSGIRRDKTGLQWSDETYIGFEDVCATDRYIYSLITNKKGKNYTSYPNTISVFDWDGNPVKQLITDKNLRCITVTKDDSKLYGIFNNEEEFGIIELKL